MSKTRVGLLGRRRRDGFVLGRDNFARISAVEGMALTNEMRAMLQGFDRDGLSAEERRRAIIGRFEPLLFPHGEKQDT
jgi:hypothetical protein